MKASKEDGEAMRRMKKHLLAYAAIAAVTMGLTLGGGVAANAAPIEQQSQIDPSAAAPVSPDWEAEFPDGSKYVSGTGFVPAPGTIQPRLLTPFDWLSCNNPNDPWHVISNWPAKYQGNITLQCGRSASTGYNHISLRHKSEWQNLINRFGGGSSWDDFMAYVTKAALNSPSAIYGAGFQKICYTTPINMINHNNGDKVTLSPTIIISSNNKTVITSYPGGNCR